MIQQVIGHFTVIISQWPFLIIFEMVVYCQLWNYSGGNELLEKEQQEFRSGRCTITAGINCNDSTINSINRDKKVVGICLN